MLAYAQNVRREQYFLFYYLSGVQSARTQSVDLPTFIKKKY